MSSIIAGSNLGSEYASKPIRLRAVQSSDLPYLSELQSDPESNRMAVTLPRTREAFDAHWEHLLKDSNLKVFAILLGDDCVGTINCYPQDGSHHVGYWLDRKFWGQGIASRALQLMLLEVPHRPLMATAAVSNTASLRVLQKCGFVLDRIELAAASERFPECEVAVHVLGPTHSQGE